MTPHTPHPHTVAIVTDWLTTMGGAEKVIWELHQHFPHAPIFTTIFNPKKAKPFAKADVRPSFLSSYPFAKSFHPLFLPWMPKAVESLDVNGHDVVISSSHSCAKGVITKPETLHICYCHTPTRYAWEMHFDERVKSRNPIARFFIERLMHRIRIWDRVAADRVDHFIANSSFVAERIKKYYRREAEIIHPPVETEKFEISPQPKEYFLAVGRLIPYKKMDLLIETCNELKLPLKIVGVGPQEAALKKLAGPTIEFLGKVEPEELRKLYSECRAFLFPQLEDFGIAPIEAMASGRPVIAFRAGGALDFIEEGKTGIFFEQQSKESLGDAIAKLQTTSFDPHFIKSHAEKFSRENFLKKIDECIEREWKKRNNTL